MKITLIHGQNHTGSSCHIGRLLAHRLAEETELTEFFLPRDLNHFCTGCYLCIEDETKCPFYREKQAIEQAIAEAELLIFTTPTYGLRASAPMKAFIDLTFINWMSHRPRKSMFSKRAVVISTAAGMGTKQAIRDITTCLFWWGIPSIKTYGIAVQAMNWEGVAEKKKTKMEKDMTKLAEKLAAAGTPRPGWKSRAAFWLMRGMQKAGWGSGETDRRYWEENGWLDRERPWK